MKIFCIRPGAQRLENELWNHCVFFDYRIFGRGLWTPRSPDLTPPDFSLWEFLKERVYSHNPRSLEDFKHTRNIDQAVSVRGGHCDDCPGRKKKLATPL